MRKESEFSVQYERTRGNEYCSNFAFEVLSKKIGTSSRTPSSRHFEVEDNELE